MAIDKNKIKRLIDEIEKIFEELVPKPYKESIKKVMLEPAIEEIKKLIETSRPPVFYLIGRNGHGKSSLINVLTSRKVAEVEDIKATTFKSTMYEIIFPGRYSVWKVVDSRGFFENTLSDKDVPMNIIEKFKQDIKKYYPDIIIHVVSVSEVKNLVRDFKIFSKTLNEIKESEGVEIPVILVLTKVDTLGNPKEWILEEFPKKVGLIEEILDYLSSEIFMDQEIEPIDKNFPYKGCLNKNSKRGFYVAAIPVCSLENNPWNVETLSYVIGEYLPESALLNFAQAQKRKKLLKKISSKLIKRFSTIAREIGTSSIPISDIFVLIPLQILLIAIIGGLSCRCVSIETVKEFLAAVGINVMIGYGLREFAKKLIKIYPEMDSIISESVAGFGTYVIGKAAEFYFFEDVILTLNDIRILERFDAINPIVI